MYVSIYASDASESVEYRNLSKATGVNQDLSLSPSEVFSVE